MSSGALSDEDLLKLGIAAGALMVERATGNKYTVDNINKANMAIVLGRSSQPGRGKATQMTVAFADIFDSYQAAEKEV